MDSHTEERAEYRDRGTSINRRRAIQALGVAAATGLAGCGTGGDGGDGNGGGGDGGGGADGGGGSDGRGGGDDSGDGTAEDGMDLGERVPTQQIGYMSNLGSPSALFERVLPVMKENVEERIGVPIEITPVEWTRIIDEVYNDKRARSMDLYSHSNNLTRLDPTEISVRFGIDYAGNNGKGNATQYANCEYTHLIKEQQSTAAEETRREQVYRAHEILSEEVGLIPVYSYPRRGAYRADMIEPAGIGPSGIWDTNPLAFMLSEPTEGDRIVANFTAASVETSNFLTHNYLAGYWTRLVHTTLTEYSEEFERRNVLASSIETSDDGLSTTVEIKEGTFHNGDPITAEDVKFTYELLNANADEYPIPSDLPLDSIEVIDDRTARFDLTEIYPALTTVTFPRWGILHRGVWAGAMENPVEFSFDPPYTGSGPFRISDFSPGQHLQLTPHDGHPVYEPDHDLFFQVYRGEQSIVQAFLEGEIQMAQRIGVGSMERIKDQLGDRAQQALARAMFPLYIAPQNSFAPTKFPAFRKGVGAAMDRQEINELGSRGEGVLERYATVFMKIHPWRPPDDRLTLLAEDPTGDEELARQVLADAGWGWDDDGRLHYPPDADLSPRWPEGEVPAGEEFPCMTADGSYDENYEP